VGDAVRTLRRYDEETVDVIIERYVAGESGPKLATEFGMPIRSFYYQLNRREIQRRPPSVPHKHPAPGQRVCAREGCKNKFTPTGYQAAQPGGGRFCSRACHYVARRVAEPEERTCARTGCTITFTPYPSEAVRPGHGQFCSMSCRGMHLFATGQMDGFVESLKERNLWGPKADERWRRLWNGLKGGRQTLLETAEEDVHKAARTALDAYRQNADVRRAEVVALVVRRLEGREPLFLVDGRRRDSRDPARRRAEKRAIRRLEVAATLPEYADTLLERRFG